MTKVLLPLPPYTLAAGVVGFSWAPSGTSKPTKKHQLQSSRVIVISLIYTEHSETNHVPPDHSVPPGPQHFFRSTRFLWDHNIPGLQCFTGNTAFLQGHSVHGATHEQKQKHHNMT